MPLAGSGRNRRVSAAYGMTVILSRGVPWPTSVSGDVVRGDEDAVGQLDVAEPPVVQPGQLVAVERAVAEVDREEVGRGLGLALENLPFLADVAVDHAQDRGDPEFAAARQGESEPTSLKIRAASGRCRGSVPPTCGRIVPCATARLHSVLDGPAWRVAPRA